MTSSNVLKKNLVLLSVVSAISLLSIKTSYAVVDVKNEDKSLTENLFNPDLIYVGRLNGNYIDAAGDYTRTLNILKD